MADKQRTDPLIVYIHIPKTAGSTVNRLLRDWDSNGRDHAHILMNTDENALKPILNSVAWVSGHSNLEKMSQQFPKLTDRKLKFYTIMRSPNLQIASHYNWLIEIFHRGPKFYNGHPARIKEISQAIRENDNTDPNAIIQLLEKYKVLFLNMQARAILGPNYKGFTVNELKERMKAYEYISTEKKLPEFLKEMTGTTVDLIPSENTSKYHFEKDVFSSAEMNTFLEKRNAHDHMVHQILSE